MEATLIMMSRALLEAPAKTGISFIPTGEDSSPQRLHDPEAIIPEEESTPKQRKAFVPWKEGGPPQDAWKAVWV